MLKLSLLVSAFLLFVFNANSNLYGDIIHVAVASNFSGAMQDLSETFEQQTGHTIIVSYGSTGKHYAQIKSGAPFELFFAADTLRPYLLEQHKQALAGSRFTYAVGQIVLWSPKTGQNDSLAAILRKGTFRYLAIANPDLAPYGKAAMQVLQKLQLWDEYQSRIVRGENISQAFQYVISANAEIGFIALSQWSGLGRQEKGSIWKVDSHFYMPIRQQAVQLKESPAARKFLEFVKSSAGRDIIEKYGYGVN